MRTRNQREPRVVSSAALSRPAKVDSAFYPVQRPSPRGRRLARLGGWLDEPWRSRPMLAVSLPLQSMWAFDATSNMRAYSDTLGFAALWVTRLARPSLWAWAPIALAVLLPDTPIEQRYSILPLSLWMLLRRDVELLTALCNAAIGVALLQLISGGHYSL